MFVQLSASNFKCLRQESCFSLLGANITEFPDSLIKSGESAQGVLPVSLLYGANGSGKSTVLKAITYPGNILRDPAGAMSRKICFFQNEDEPTCLDMILRSALREYEYIIKIKKGQVVEEKLYAGALKADKYQVIFDRDQDGVYLAKSLEHLEVSDISDEMPFIAVVVERAPEDPCVKEFGELAGRIRYENASALTDASILDALHDPAAQELFLKAVSCVQSRITDVYEKEGRIVIKYGEMEITPAESGEGLSQLIRLLALSATVIRGGRVLLLDDASQKLHPKAFRFLIEMFTNPSVNTRGAQLIATSYDMPTMSNQVLRRDEIWMSDCNRNGETCIYPLALFLKENGEKVRKDETYFKQFLEGRYGTDMVPATLWQEESL